jgi:hypothetical protein
VTLPSSTTSKEEDERRPFEMVADDRGIDPSAHDDVGELP